LFRCCQANVKYVAAARVFAALGSHIHAYTAGPRPTPASRADHGYFVPGTGDPDGSIPRAWYSGTTKPALHTFLASGLDALIIALPLTKSTRHLFGEEEFAVLAKSPGGPEGTETDGSPEGGSKCFLINIARGPIIDQPALVAALDHETLSGAALDVTDPEPLPADDPLWNAKNVIITPHVSALGVEYKDRAFDLFVTNWKRHEHGQRMFNVVDRKKGY
jgi:phosphoglycerate dehydrogenase-like enzyme